jgi:hypothetical protein
MSNRTTHYAVFIFPLLLLWQSSACHTSPANMNNAPAEKRIEIPSGTWGGEHINLEVTAGGANVEFDCAHGIVSEPLETDNAGRFAAKGTFAFEHGGPVRESEAPANRQVNYSGTIKGARMTLTITFVDSAKSLDSFTLIKDKEGRLTKCR